MSCLNSFGEILFRMEVYEAQLISDDGNEETSNETALKDRDNV